MRVDFKIEGAKEMERVLRELGPDVANRVGRQALRAGAKVIIDEAKRLVPVDSGALRDSIAVREDRKLKASVGHEIGVNIGFLKPASRRAHLIEFGTSKSPAKPFMRPAMDSQAPAALDQMGKVLARGIDREAKKLAKPAKS